MLENPVQATGASKNKRLKKFRLDNGLLLITQGNGSKIVVPPPFRNRILSLFHGHKLCGHFGIKRTTERVQRQYFWNGLSNDVKDFVRRCVTCAQYKPQSGPQKGFKHSQAHSAPWETVFLDFVGPLTRSSTGNKYLLVFQDGFTRAIELVAVRQATAVVVAKHLFERIVCRHGIPHRVVSDNASTFRAQLYAETCKLLDIDPRYVTPHYPAANRAERANQDLVKQIAILAQNRHTTWDTATPAIQFSFNSAINRSTGYSPFFLNYFREPRLPAIMTTPRTPPTLPEDVPAFVRHLADTVPGIFHEVLENTAAATVTHAKHYNQGRSNEEYNEGDIVYDKTFYISCAADQFTKNLAPLYAGPFKITKKHSDVSYDISYLHTGVLAGKRHISQLKKVPHLEELARPGSAASHTGEIPPTDNAVVDPLGQEIGATAGSSPPHAQQQHPDSTGPTDTAVASTTQPHDPAATPSCAAEWCTSTDPHWLKIKCSACARTYHRVCANIFRADIQTFVCARCR